VLHSPDNEIWAVEIKRSTAPRLTRGFYEACRDIQATHKWVVTSDSERYPLPEKVEVIGLMDFLEIIQNKQHDL